MTTTERKARKRAGIPFSKPEKIPTPPAERSFVTQPVVGPVGTRHAGAFQKRSLKKREAFLARFTPAEPVE